MASQIFLNVRPHQTRIALLKDGILKNISYHQTSHPSMVGSIYKGKVLRIDPVLNFAFIDIGLKKACFLYGKDLLEKSGKVSEALNHKQDVLIQIKSDPINDKGSRCTTEVSLPGFYMVFVPRAEKKTVLSRQISNEDERKRLKEIFRNFKVDGCLIVRTLAQGKQEEELKKDLEKLKSQWSQIDRSFKNSNSFGKIQDREDEKFDYLKDLITEDIKDITIDDQEAYVKVRKSFESSSSLQKKVLSYRKKQALFKNFDVESQIEKALNKKVNLKSGGSLIFEELEAFTVIDVNTARFKGKKSLSESILAVNLESALKIAEHIILRHLGGIILVDFIDMDDEKDRKEVVACLADELKKDKLKAKVFPMADLGLVQITRKRQGLSLAKTLKENCPHCKGEGYRKKISVISGDLLYRLESYSPFFKVPFFKQTKKVKVSCHQSLKDWIDSKEQDSLDFLKEKHKVEAFFVEDSTLDRSEFKILSS